MASSGAGPSLDRKQNLVHLRHLRDAADTKSRLARRRRRAALP